jgi:6,7-dimethyl-8-ribityllumazine synthase
VADRGGGERFAIVVARFYADMAERLVAGACEAFSGHGAEVEVHDVPGAFELPLAARLCVDSGRYAGVAALGCVVRGETDHYEYVCAEAARGLASVGLESRVPCAFGVLTVETREQALERSGGSKRHAGREAAEAVVRMAELRRTLAGPETRSDGQRATATTRS